MSEKHFTREDAKKIGEKLGIKWNKFNVEQFRMGLDVELEHGARDPETDVTHSDPITTGKIRSLHENSSNFQAFEPPPVGEWFKIASLVLGFSVQSNWRMAENRACAS